ncbi:MAG: hypothetical protein WAM14_03460 [Candidatus Nitrosopolaris sp.]
MPLQKTKTKKCTRCKKTKLLNEHFPHNRSAKDGYNSTCSVCMRALNKQWRLKNPEKNREKNRRWNEANTEWRKQYEREYRSRKRMLIRSKAR